MTIHSQRFNLSVSPHEINEMDADPKCSQVNRFTEGFSAFQINGIALKGGYATSTM